MKRYQESPWYIKTYRRCRHMPVMYIKMFWTILWWIVTGAKPYLYFSRLTTLKHIKNWHVSMCHFDMGYWYTTDETIYLGYDSLRQASVFKSGDEILRLLDCDEAIDWRSDLAKKLDEESVKIPESRNRVVQAMFTHQIPYDPEIWDELKKIC